MQMGGREMAKKMGYKPPVTMLDPMRDWPDMMSVKDVAQFAGIGITAATNFIQRNGGVKVTEGGVRSSWRIHKEYVRKAFNVPFRVDMG